MASKKNGKPGAQPESAGPAPKKRFRIEKRQDRISRGIYHQKHDAQSR